MAKAGILAFRASAGFREAVDQAARLHGTDRSKLIHSWIHDRLAAEGFAVVEKPEKEDDDG